VEHWVNGVEKEHDLIVAVVLVVVILVLVYPAVACYKRRVYT
jgi:uncharacterized protein (UPF0333 family)